MHDLAVQDGRPAGEIQGDGLGERFERFNAGGDPKVSLVVWNGGVAQREMDLLDVGNGCASLLSAVAAGLSKPMPALFLGFSGNFL